jgi:hypothetical protein
MPPDAGATKFASWTILMQTRRLPDDLAAMAFGREWYVRTRSDVPVPDREGDLFAGLR